MKLGALVSLSLLLLYGAAPLQGAQTWPYVTLVCEIEALELKSHWRPLTATVEHNTCELIRKHLQKDAFLVYWKFQVGSSSKSQWSLRLSLKDGKFSGEILLRLELWTPAGNREWYQIWREAREKGIFSDPSTAEAPWRIFRDFKGLLETIRPDFEESLGKGVPIGSGGRILLPEGNEGVRILSWLEWERFHGLRSSMFDVLCRYVERGNAVLVSQGHPRPAFHEGRGEVVVLMVREYSFDDGRRRQPVTRMNSDELLKLEPRYVYLKEFIQSEWERYP